MDKPDIEAWDISDTEQATVLYALRFLQQYYKSYGLHTRTDCTPAVGKPLTYVDQVLLTPDQIDEFIEERVK